MPDYQSVKKILIIKLRGIGDVVLASIVFNSIKKAFPEATIDFLTEKPSNFLLQPLPQINEIILFRKKTLLERISTFLEIRKNKYDLILDFYSNPGTAQAVFLSGAKFRAGFPYKGRKYAYNLFGPEERDKYHAAELHIEFLKKIGILVEKNPTLQFGMEKADLKKSEKYKSELNSGDNLLIGLAPSGGWQSKKAAPEVFINFALKLQTRIKNVKFLIHWGPGDEKDAEQIKTSLGENAVLAPPTTITEMGAFLKICDAVIANDSGPMHICAAVETPVLGLFGPTAPRLQGPYGNQNSFIHKNELDCIECNLLQCPYNQECFNELSPDRIVDEFIEMMNKNGLL